MRVTAKYLSIVGITLLIFEFAPGGPRGLTRSSEGPSRESKKDSITVTGCLIKIDNEGKTSITSKDGKNYVLKSSTIRLKEHIDQTVRVTGTVGNIDDDEDYESAEYREAGVKLLIVKDLKVISSKCT
ncbi:MAG TPA: hypothetical protein VKM94_04755 [Blastocatellia bacterium]|nr:hypothetical protein [Blastocatellia bacterium]